MVKQTGRNVQKQPRRRKSRANATFVQSAKSQEQQHNYDEASQLYLRGGQVYSAAKMKALKGPIGADEAINIIQVNSPDQVEMIIRNLVNEFYYRLNQPATASALLRSVGFIDEAIAVEVAAGIASQTITVSTPAGTSAEMGSEPITTPPPAEINEIDSVEEMQVAEEVEIASPSKPDKIQNTLMMASVTLSDKCIVCRRDITSGDSFLQCLSCGKPGHYKHIAEMIKVTGKCPNCKERLVMHMFDL